MSYDEEQQKRERSRVVVQTPTARREVVQETVRYPAERRGYGAGTIALVALTAIAATVILMLFLTNPSDDSDSTNINVRASVPVQPTPYTQAPVMVQTPLPPLTQQTPATIIIQQPAPAQPPVIVAPPPATSAAPTTSAPPAPAEPSAAKGGTDDLALQQKVDKAFADDTEVAAANVFATVVNGRVRLSGNVTSEALKQRAERLAYSIKGVLGVDNKLTVSPAP